MLTEQQILNNKQEFISILNLITIPEANIQGLIEWLENSDFFYAPASTVYHNNFKGGLCAHSLNVYKMLCSLVNTSNNFTPVAIDQSSLIIAGLLHDISKTNFYEMSTVNKKRYYPGGSKHDNLGAFDWYSEESYKVIDAKDRVVLGNHEESSVILLSRFIPLTQEELIAIMNHHCNTNNGIQSYDLSPMLNKNPLLALLHTADFLSTFLLEADNNNSGVQKV